ncbi:GNAT family N-acetyltransferase [Phaeobacter marinintestinus]|uniref:GNAT family N-acetyltransferase n=1 Tax=Falsiphaeobacter marinintestinus TaxID=1492905 RepID=UPI003CCC7DA9
MPVTTKLPRPRPPLTPMQGRTARLIPTQTSHAPALYDAFARDTDGRNWTYLPYGPFATEADFTTWMEATCQGDDPLFHTVCTAEGTPVGLATFLRIDPGAGVIEVGHIHFSPLMQGSAVSTEAMYLMMKRVFDELGYRRYEWKCDALNAPSCAAAERLGFTYEGTFRQATTYKGRNRDTAWFSILDSEWPHLKTAFKAWLAPENFDENGRQRQSLTDLR